MTRSRSTYEYEAQSVASPNGVFRLESLRETEPSLSLLQDDLPRWSRPVERVSPKQLFVADDGRSAVLDAADVVSFRASDGELVGRVSLLHEGSDGDPSDRGRGPSGSPVTWSTAGPSWDDHLAAGFCDFGTSACLVVSGRGRGPLVYDPADASRVDVSDADIRDAQRARAPRILAEALEALRTPGSDDRRGREPWRLAAVGWSRVAGETEARDALSTLRALAALPMAVDGMTYMPAHPQPRDPFRVGRFALDPLRQATHAALLRMGQPAPADAVLQLARRRGWFRCDWVTIDRPPNWATALEQAAPGITPSSLVDLLGAPNHVAEYEGRIVWSYDYLESGEAKTVQIRWAKTGAEDVVCGVMPEASPNGRVA